MVNRANDCEFVQTYWDNAIIRKYAASTPTFSFGPVIAQDNEFCDLGDGSYTIDVVDVANCAEAINFSIIEPTELSIDNIAVTNTWCYDNTQGELDITVSGGTIPYSFSWSGPLSFTSSSEDLTGLGAGLYGVVVADDNACTDNSTAIVGTNTPLNPPSFTWTGNTNQLWQDYTNWDCGLPDANSQVVLPNPLPSGNTPIILNGIVGDVYDIEIRSTTPPWPGNIIDYLEIQDGGTLNIHQP